MTDETNGSGAGERECAETSPSVDWVPGVWADHEHKCTTHARGEHECACGAKWEIPCDHATTEFVNDVAGWCCSHCGAAVDPDASTGASEGLSEPTWMRPVPEAMMNDERLDVLLSEFYHSDDGDYVSALGDIRKHVAARESAAATKRVEDAAQTIALMPAEHRPRSVVASIFTGHTLGCICEVCAFVGEEPSAAATRARAEGAAAALMVVEVHRLHPSMNICTGCDWRAVPNAGSLRDQHWQHVNHIARSES